MYVNFFVFIFAILREHIRNGAIDDQKQSSEAFSISSDKQQNVTCDGRGKNLKKERNIPSTTTNASTTSEAVASARSFTPSPPRSPVIIRGSLANLEYLSDTGMYWLFNLFN